VDGKKMSKSRGTFIKASDYLKHLDPEYLRYYFASKLNDGIEDIDLNFEDFTKKINSDLVGKLINLASRCSSFLEKNSNFTLSEKLENDEKFKDFINQANEVEKYYSNRKFSNAISKIMQMTDNANQYINQEKPWSLKDIKKIQQISTQGLNYFRSLAILLSPIMPDLFEKTEIMFNEKNLKWENCFSPLLNKKIKKFTVLKTRIKDESIEQLKSNLINNSESSSKEESKMQNEIEYDIFSKTEIRIGEIITAEEIDGADKLLKLSVDIGDLGEREIFAGIKKFYEAKNLIGSKVLVVVNLKPKKMKFGTSSGMVLAADSEGEIIVIEANNKIKNGSRVK
jgi:methionyl-tRNA synthetase